MNTSIRRPLLMSALFLSICFSTFKITGQQFNTGDKILNAGIGLGTPYYKSSFNTILPPIFISGDYGFRDDVGPGTIGLGGYIGYSSAKEKYGAGLNYGWKYSNLILGARGTYHYEFIDNFDTYAGVLLGLMFESVKVYGETAGSPILAKGSDTNLVFGLYIGGRYYFSDNLGLIVELGFGSAYLSVGVSLKL